MDMDTNMTDLGFHLEKTESDTNTVNLKTDISWVSNVSISFSNNLFCCFCHCWYFCHFSRKGVF